MPDLAAAPARPSSDARASRASWYAVTVAFFVNGVLFASWTAHIPHVKEYLRLTDGTLGFALLGAPVGSALAMLLAARLLPWLGSKLMVRITMTGYCLAGPLVGLAGSVGALFAALMVWGAFQGTLDVSMNTQAISVERRAGRTLMPGFHGTWSIGSFAGAAIGAGGVAIGLSLSRQLLIMAVPCLLAGGWLTASMIPDDQAPAAQPARTAEAGPGDEPAAGAGAAPAGQRREARTGRRAVWAALAVLGAISIADMLCEGAAADWAAVYLHGSLGAVPAIAALGFACYSLAMVIVRLAGNRLLTKFSARHVLPCLATAATVALVISLAVNTIPALLIGFASLGAGLAAVIPVAFSAAGRIPGINAGTAVAMVSAVGWAGFVCGPPLIGQLADATSLRLALLLVPALTALIAVSTAVSKALRPS